VGQARGIFLSGSDLHRGHYSQDDVVIRCTVGFHDAAFDVNCEERRSRSRFIPSVVCVVAAEKDVQTSNRRRRTHVSILFQPGPRSNVDQASLNHSWILESLESEEIMV